MGSEFECSEFECSVFEPQLYSSCIAIFGALVSALGTSPHSKGITRIIFPIKPFLPLFLICFFFSRLSRKQTLQDVLSFAGLTRVGQATPLLL